jgi:hypothetical protein
VALDGNGSNSPFTKALGRHVRTPGLEVRQMLTRVRADVAAETGGRQIPWDNSPLLGEVYLAGAGRPEPQRVEAAADVLVWEGYQELGRCDRVRGVREQISNQWSRPGGAGTRR